MSRVHTVAWIVPLGLTLLLTGASCNDDHEDARLVPPLEIRNTVPADGAVINPMPGEKINLSVDFRSAPVSDAVAFEVYPPPLSVGTFGPSSDRVNWSLRDVELSPGSATHYWLIQATQMRRPVVVRLSGAGTFEDVGFGGTIFAPDSTLVKAEGTVIFSIDNAAPFNALDPRTFLDCEPRTLSVAEFVVDGREADYLHGYTAEFDTVMVVAIKDTNGDLVYDPSDDWWGYRHLPAQVAPEFVITSSFAAQPGEPPFRTDAHITLQPPFVPVGER